MTITINYKTTKKTLNTTYQTVDLIVYENVLGFTFEVIEEIEEENKMCIVLHLEDGERATWSCENIVSIEEV
jgi:hypothetical protein